MDWIKEHKTLAAILGVAGAGAVGLGVVMWNAYSAYSAGLEQYDTVSNTLGRMESAPLYPSKENLDKKTAMVQQFATEVEKLQQTLLQLQPPVKDITDTDFQARLKQRMAETRAKVGGGSAESGKLPKNFAFGFDQYVNNLPPQDAAKDVNDYFDAVDSIVQMALDSGVKSIVSLSRSELPSEKTGGAAAKPTAADSAAAFMNPGQPKVAPGPKGKGKATGPAAPPPTKVIERRTVKMSLISDQPALQAMLNDLASASKMLHFAVVRVLRIENEKLTGPSKSVAAPEKAEDVPDAPPEPGTSPAPTAPAGPEVLVAPRPAPADAVIVMGGENLHFYLEIDLIKYVDGE
jgi:hypothetical protein